MRSGSKDTSGDELLAHLDGRSARTGGCHKGPGRILRDTRAMREETYLSQVEGRAITSIVVISIHMEHLLSVDRKQTREDTFGQTGALKYQFYVPL